MNSGILQIASRYIRFFLLLFAILTLLRGHNYPGGGFIGGLIAAIAIIYDGFAYRFSDVGKKFQKIPFKMMGVGLLLILLSMLPSLILNQQLMQGGWIILLNQTVKLGTPLLFDVGVFFAVIGVTIMFLISLNKN